VLWYVIIVTPLLFMPIIFGRRGALEQVAHHVDTLRLFIDQAKFSAAQRQLYWHSLIEKYIHAVQPRFDQAPPSVADSAKR